MPPEPTNLLFSEKIRAFRREYFYRLATIAALALALLVGVHSILLLPTHMLLASGIETHEAELAALTATGSSPDEAAFEARLALLARSAKELIALDASPNAVARVSDVLLIPHPGVTLSGLSYLAPSGNKKAPVITLSGIARERDGLRQYQLALQKAPFAATADLPVATYAKDTDIPFMLTLTLTAP